jgi:hypothetical protein
VYDVYEGLGVEVLPLLAVGENHHDDSSANEWWFSGNKDVFEVVATGVVGTMMCCE